MSAEIQIRTLLQHTWAAIQHKLEYKSALDIPREFRRRLVRLSGLLELADEEFCILRREQAALTTTIAHQVAHGQLEISINALSLREFVPHSNEVHRLTEIAERAGIRVYEIRSTSTDQPSVETMELGEEGISQLVRVCEIVGIQTIARLGENLKTISATAATKLYSHMAKIYGESSLSGSTAHWTAVAVTAALLSNVPAERAARRIGWGVDYQRAIEDSASAAFRRTQSRGS